MFKQFMQAKAFEFCQVDSARIGGVNELLIVYLMAKKFNIKVCPHAGKKFIKMLPSILNSAVF